MGTITWVGIDEKCDEESTRRFDQETIREAVHTSGNEDLIRELEAGRITSHRHPAGKPRGSSGRGRIIKIRLANQELRDALLSHVRTGRQSLTEQFVHSFARRDYKAEELNLDRALRKRAGDLNALEDLLKINWRDLLSSAATADECYNIYLHFCNEIISRHVSITYQRNRVKRFSKKLKRELAHHQLAEEDKIVSCKDQKTLYNYINTHIKNQGQ
ncbi:hypothetical protein ANCDUO_18753, partial [Ancylostoma duodenale]